MEIEISGREKSRLSSSNKTSSLLRWFVLVCCLIEAIGGILLSSVSPSEPLPPPSFLFIQLLVAILRGKLLTTIRQLEKDDQYYCQCGEGKIIPWEMSCMDIIISTLTESSKSSKNPVPVVL